MAIFFKTRGLVRAVLAELIALGQLIANFRMESHKMDQRILDAINRGNAKVDEFATAIATELGEIKDLVKPNPDLDPVEAAAAIDTAFGRLDTLQTAVQSFSDQLTPPAEPPIEG